MANPTQSLRPLVILLVGLALANVCLTLMLRFHVLRSETFALGLLVGELMFLAVMAGGVGRSGVFQLVMTSLIAIGGGWLILAVGIRSWQDSPLDLALGILAVMPPVLFCVSLPFLLVRALSGYRLGQVSQVVHGGRSMRLEDFFLTTAVLGAMFVTVPAYLKTLGDVESSFIATMMLSVGAASCGIGALVALPATWAYLAVQKRWLGLAVLVVCCLVVPFLIVNTISMVMGWPLSRASLLDVFGPVLVTATGCFAMCLVIVRALHFHWLHDCEPERVSAPLEDDDLNAAHDYGDRLATLRNRVAALVLLLSSGFQVVGYGALANERRRLESGLKDLDERWSSWGGHVNFDRYTAYGFTAPPHATRSDITAALDSNRLVHVNLSRTAVTDQVLAGMGFQYHLQTLNLNHTGISDVGLSNLPSSQDLSTIDLNYSRVTAAGLQQFLKRQRGYRLSVGGLGLTDADIAKLRLKSFVYLDLRDNPLTNACLPALAHAYELNLSQTQIDGEGLVKLTQTFTLGLDGTRINDAQLQAFFDLKPKVNSLSLRGTQITRASLPLLKNMQQLFIDSPDITPQSLGQAELAATHLGLNAPHFDGSIFAQGKWQVQSLDMSGSGISDNDIHHLKKLGALESLDLSDCDLSEAALPALASLRVNSIDVTGTKISGEAAQLLNRTATYVYLSSSQCSAKLLADLTPDSNLVIDRRLNDEAKQR